MVSEALLTEFGAKKVSFDKSEIVFKQGDLAKYYYQIFKGSVKMSNFNDEGKEFVQGIFTEGNSFGEPPLFIDDTYPANAIAVTSVEVYLLKKEKFFELLVSNPEIHLKMTINLARRLYYKSMMASEISSHDPEHRILQLIDYFKFKIHKSSIEKKYKVEVTRQQIADLTGLRVETVIRSIKSLEKKGELTINNHKVYR